MKRKLLIIIILLLSTIMLVKSNMNKDIKVNYHPVLNMYDMSTPEKAVGAVDYVFVARINSIKKTLYSDYEPYTVYNITILENIKGNLLTDITLTQMGGISKSKKEYILPSDTKLLKQGKTYLILSYVPEYNGDLQINSNYNYIELNDSKDELITRYQQAYKNEEVPEQKKDSFISKYDISLNQ